MTEKLLDKDIYKPEFYFDSSNAKEPIFTLTPQAHDAVYKYDYLSFTLYHLPHEGRLVFCDSTDFILRSFIYQPTATIYRRPIYYPLNRHILIINSQLYLLTLQQTIEEREYIFHLSNIPLTKRTIPEPLLYQQFPSDIPSLDYYTYPLVHEKFVYLNDKRRPHIIAAYRDLDGELISVSTEEFFNQTLNRDFSIFSLCDANINAQIVEGKPLFISCLEASLSRQHKKSPLSPSFTFLKLPLRSLPSNLKMTTHLGSFTLKIPAENYVKIVSFSEELILLAYISVKTAKINYNLIYIDNGIVKTETLDTKGVPKLFRNTVTYINRRFDDYAVRESYPEKSLCYIPLYPIESRYVISCSHRKFIYEPGLSELPCLMKTVGDEVECYEIAPPHKIAWKIHSKVRTGVTLPANSLLTLSHKIMTQFTLLIDYNYSTLKFSNLRFADDGSDRSSLQHIYRRARFYYAAKNSSDTYDIEYDPYTLQIKNFNWVAFDIMNYNPSYYEQLASLTENQAFHDNQVTEIIEETRETEEIQAEISNNFDEADSSDELSDEIAEEDYLFVDEASLFSSTSRSLIDLKNSSSLIQYYSVTFGGDMSWLDYLYLKNFGVYLSNDLYASITRYNNKFYAATRGSRLVRSDAGDWRCLEVKKTRMPFTPKIFT